MCEHKKAAEGLIYSCVISVFCCESHKKRIPSDWLAWQVFFTRWEERYPGKAGGYVKNTLFACLMRMV